MTRIKGGPRAKQRHKKVLKLAKGYRMTRSRLFGVAKEAVLHAGEYAFAGRRDRKSQFRALWITRLNAALDPFELSYSTFINLLKKKNVELDRKILSQLAVEHPQTFESIVAEIKK